MVESVKDYKESTSLSQNIQVKKVHLRRIDLLLEDLNLLYMMIDESRARFERTTRKTQSPSNAKIAVLSALPA